MLIGVTNGNIMYKLLRQMKNKASIPSLHLQPMESYMQNFSSLHLQPLESYMVNFSSLHLQPMESYMQNFSSLHLQPIETYMLNFSSLHLHPIGTYMQNFSSHHFQPIESYMQNLSLLDDNAMDHLINMTSLYSLHLQNYMKEFEERYLSKSELNQQVSFWLYTRYNPQCKQILYVNDPDSILDSYFSSDKKTVVLVHGWLNAGNMSFSQTLKNSYLELHDYNIICVDWSNLASNRLYPLARWTIKYIGQHLADMLTTIERTTGYDWCMFHLVGHSLGAHVCGIAGENIAHGKIGRITGLDPALPLFSSNITGRLDSTDATFVDIIHTCGGYLGYYQPCGHVDFYPNGGTFIQPGCGWDIGTCSHTRSYMFFTESIRTKIGFYARQCNSWSDYKKGHCKGSVEDMILMGEHVNTSARGKYYLMTASSKPYALGRYFPQPKHDTFPSSRGQLRGHLRTYRKYVNSVLIKEAKRIGYKMALLSNTVYSWFWQARAQE
ncbi:hypothetical protein M8J76_013563 [Diaphorina citri]|nr:hypothetical protein M8J76_013563 [Diaphorina citri]